ncbi:MAG TPA: 2-aminoethylphosphonate--pyruvate transaminase [Sorangium sp.]|nr:2-aminoethylphosphonate--pyruvate transaminase [Sorangium sp.]
MIDLAIVGLGRWGTFLVDAVQGVSPKVRFAAAVSRTPGRVEQAAASRGIKVLASLEEALAQPTIAGIVLATPHSLHAAQIEACVRAGRPVFVEKPFTLTSSSAVQASAAASAAGVVVAAGFNRRFLPAMRKLKSVVGEGGLGTLRHIESNFTANLIGRFSPGQWRLTAEENPAGGFAGGGIHMIDAIIHLGGPVTGVFAVGSSRIPALAPLEDTVSALLTLASGATASVTTMMATAPTFRLQVFGTQGSAEIRDPNTLEIVDLAGKGRFFSFEAVSTERAEIEAFADAISGEAPYPIPMDDVLNGVAAFEAIGRSLSTGGPVSIAEGGCLEIRMNRRHDHYLLTPGPLTVPPEIRETMLLDRNPYAGDFVDMTAAIRRYLLEIANGTETHACVPLQGSASYAIEAAMQTLVPHTGTILIVQNGFYGIRLREIAEGIRLKVATLDLPMLPLPTRDDLEKALDADPSITHIAMCHAETGTGVLNPVEMVAEVARRRGKRLIVDAVASFGGFPIDVAALDLEALIISPNKCLESVPGIGLVLVNKDALAASAGRSMSLSLDLHAQWSTMEKSGIWRWTPPTHVVAALASACERHRREGGVAARGARYRRNWRILIDGFRQWGFRTLIPDEVAIPIIATFHVPEPFAHDFRPFYEALERRGITIFPGRLTAAGTFRISVMGDLVESDIRMIMNVIREVLGEIDSRYKDLPRIS